MTFSVIPRCNVSGASGVVIPPATAAKWYPGHYWKLEDWQVVNQSTGALNTSSLNTIFQEVKDTFSCRGIKWTIEWGDVENGNWTVINELCKRLWSLRQGTNPKYARLMLAINLKGEGVTATAINKLLPLDLVVAGGFTPTKSGYTAYTNAFPWKDNGGTTPSGYYPKLWKTVIQSRLAAFCQTLAAHVPPNCDGKSLDQGDILCMVSSLESANDAAYDGFQDSTTGDGDPTGSQSSYEQGLWDYVQNLKLAFPKTPVTMSLNYSRPFIADIIPQLPGKKIGINTPNGNYANGLNLVDQSAPITNGILLYFQDPAYYNSIIMNSEVQGDDFKSTMGIDARADKLGVDAPPGYDFPPYADLYLRHKNTLHAHYMVWQRNFPFWLGGTFSEKLNTTDPSYATAGPTYTWPGTRPSCLNTFMKTYAALNNPADPAGGLNTTPPTNWL